MAIDKKHVPMNSRVDERLAAEITSRLAEDGALPCVSAIALAQAKNIDPLEIGRAADALKIRLGRCQLGLFGFPGRAKGWETAGVAGLPVPRPFENALRGAAAASGSLSCSMIWRLADAHGLSRVRAGCAADKLGLKIVDCQLGAF
jgi:hypothetical protein